MVSHYSSSPLIGAFSPPLREIELIVMRSANLEITHLEDLREKMNVDSSVE